MKGSSDITTVLAEVGPRLKRVRTERGATLAQLSAATGISKSTLSRLESGQRKPSLELLLPIALAHQVSLDDLIGAPAVGDPRIPLDTPQVRSNGRIVYPLSRQPRDLHAWKVVIPPESGVPEMRTHEGYEWFYVLAGQLRLILANHDFIMGPGEVAEFETRFPHWFGSANDQPVEILSLLGQHGERTHGGAQAHGHQTTRRGRKEVAEGRILRR
ncbi:MAG: helix-turn-helix domain-containing protein [Actinomycetota bacterium]